MFEKRQDAYKCKECGKIYQSVPMSKCTCGHEMLSSITGDIGYKKITIAKSFFGEWKEV